MWGSMRVHSALRSSSTLALRGLNRIPPRTGHSFKPAPSAARGARYGRCLAAFLVLPAPLTAVSAVAPADGQRAGQDAEG